MKIRVHIKNGEISIDENVYIDIELPAVPRRTEVVYLEQEHLNMLEEKAKSDIKVARFYYSWFYGISYHIRTQPQKITEDNLKDLGFDDAIYVQNVYYIPNSDIIHIELGDDNRELND